MEAGKFPMETVFDITIDGDRNAHNKHSETDGHFAFEDTCPRRPVVALPVHPSGPQSRDHRRGPGDDQDIARGEETPGVKEEVENLEAEGNSEESDGEVGGSRMPADVMADGLFCRSIMRQSLARQSVLWSVDGASPQSSRLSRCGYPHRCGRQTSAQIGRAPGPCGDRLRPNYPGGTKRTAFNVCVAPWEILRKGPRFLVLWSLT
jgi:hypothetical protein